MLRKTRLSFWIFVPVMLLRCADMATGQGYDPTTAPQRMHVPPGLKVKLFASEPEIRQPILVKCDERGRLWVIQYLQYPNPAGLKRLQVDRYSRTVYDRVPEPPPQGPRGADRITILEDLDGDGDADRSKDFVDGLNLATGLAFGHGGVFVLQVPYLLFYPDRNRDDVPDSDPEVVLSGFGMEDAQSFANHLTWGPDGWLYGVNGSTTTCRIRGLEFQQGVWRYHPLSRDFELFCEGGGNLFGLTFDAQGNLFYSSNGNFLFFHGIQGAYYPKNYGKHGPLHNLYAYGTLTHVSYTGQFLGPTTGGTVYLGDAFPIEYRNSFMAGNFLGHSASWWTVRSQGSTFEARLAGSLLESNDSWFGATDLCLGPDGAVYICDFHDQRTAHPDPDANWDRSNGRIYKIETIAPRAHKDIDIGSASVSELIETLAHPNGWYRDQARLQLAARRSPQTAAQLISHFEEQHDDRNALQSLWALYVSGGWSESIALRCLEHPAEYVRCWSVRFLGDGKSISDRVASRLVQLAQHEPSVVVRAQLAASARRLNGHQAIPIVLALLAHEQDHTDRNIPWLLWWALEDKAISHRGDLVQIAGVADSWRNRQWQENFGRLIRRYAAEGTSDGYSACLQLLDATPSAHLNNMLEQISLGLGERHRTLAGMGAGDLYESIAATSADRNPFAVKDGIRVMSSDRERALRGPLKDRILQLWNSSANDSTRLRLALLTEDPAPYEFLVNSIGRSDLDEATLLKRLQLLTEFGKPQSISNVLEFLGTKRSEKIARATLDILGRFSDPRVTRFLLDSYPEISKELQSQVRTILFGRPESARAFLGLVAEKRIAADQVPIDQLRVLAHHKDPQIDATVRAHWGNVGPGTAEEKLAEIRRLNNDLRAASGDATVGAELFKKHCGTCHKRQGEGGDVGPDLTAVSRDRNFLLTSLVDPSVVIRSQYLAYVVTTENGQILTGSMIEQDAGSITIMDAKAQKTKLLRDRITEIRESSTSLMPDNILTQLTPQQLRDLFAFLESNPK